MARNSLLLGIILILSGLVLYFWESPPTLLQRDGVQESTESRPYAIVENTFTRHYNPLGELDYTFSAAQLQYFRSADGSQEDDNYTLIESPGLTLFHEGEPWRMQARQGKFSEQNRLLLLWDQVVVAQASGEGDETTLHTEELTIKLAEKLAYTDKPVAIHSPAGRLNATGMVADLQAKTITLQSNVRGHYEPL